MSEATKDDAKEAFNRQYGMDHRHREELERLSYVVALAEKLFVMRVAEAIKGDSYRELTHIRFLAQQSLVEAGEFITTCTESRSELDAKHAAERSEQGSGT